jgi:hypothetical protein
MLKNILQLKAPTLATKGNLNNHLGVPMTLLRLAEKHQYIKAAKLTDMCIKRVGDYGNIRAGYLTQMGNFTQMIRPHFNDSVLVFFC